MLLSHMAFMSEGFSSGAVSRGGGHVGRAGAPAKEEGAKYHLGAHFLLPALYLSDLCHTCLTHAMPGPRITRDNSYGAPLAPGYSSKSTAWLVRDWSICSRTSVRTIFGKLSAWSSASSGSTSVAVLSSLLEYKF